MKSKQRFCLTADGEVVTADDVRGVELLVGEGCDIPENVANKYGFVNGELPRAMPIETKEEPAKATDKNTSKSKQESKTPQARGN